MTEQLRENIHVPPIDQTPEGRKKIANASIRGLTFNTAKRLAIQNSLAFADSILRRNDPVYQEYLRAANGDKNLARIFYLENKKRQTEEGQLASQDPEPLLDPFGDEVGSFIHYFTQTKTKNRFAIPEWADWNAGFYPSNNGESDLLPGVYLPHGLASLASNYEEVASAFRDKKDEIQTILGLKPDESAESTELPLGNLLIVSNHCTWLNLPMLVAFLHLECEVPLDKIITILGPALMVYEQGNQFSGLSGRLLTVPDTPNGRMDQFPERGKSITSKFIRQLTGKMNEGGNVFMLNPSGTSDRVDKQSPRTIDLLQPSPTAAKLVERIGKKSHTWVIATHTGGIFGGHRAQQGKFDFRSGGILPPETDGSRIDELFEEVQRLNPDRTVRVLEEKDWEPGIEIIGQGRFGVALTTALEHNTKNAVDTVISLSKSEANNKPDRPRHRTLILAVPSEAKKAMEMYIDANPHSHIVMTAKGPNARKMYADLDEKERDRVAILSGPNSAEEIAQGEPAAAVLAGTNREMLEALHAQMSGPNLRLYISESPTVVQLSGILKNLIVLELGKIWGQLNPAQKTNILMESLRAAYTVIKKEAPENENPEEFWGISGVGDIILCLKFFENSNGSRNFKYGEAISSNEDPAEAQKRLGTIEGLPTQNLWRSEDPDWLKTPAMEALKAKIDNPSSIESITSDHLTEEPRILFIHAFHELDQICQQLDLNQNVRAWAFCRLHMELRGLFPDGDKHGILTQMCSVILENNFEAKEKAEPKFPDNLNFNDQPLLATLKNLRERNITIGAAQKTILERSTLTEGF